MRYYRSNRFVSFKYAKGKIDIYGRILHDYYEVYMLLGGEVEFTNNHIRQKIKPYQVIIVPPGEYHQFVAVGDVENYERCVLNIYPEFFEEGVLEKAFRGKEILTFSKSHRVVKNCFYLIDGLSDISEEDFKYVMSAVATDIVFLIKNNKNTDDSISEKMHDVALDLMGYIDEHYMEPLNLQDLSKMAHLSVSSLCHIFKKSFGISIKKYILEKRMNGANLALKSGKKPEAVSLAYGFSGYSTFYRAYKKYYGFAPSETVKRS